MAPSRPPAQNWGPQGDGGWNSIQDSPLWERLEGPTRTGCWGPGWGAGCCGWGVTLGRAPFHLPSLVCCDLGGGRAGMWEPGGLGLQAWSPPLPPPRSSLDPALGPQTLKGVKGPWQAEAQRGATGSEGGLECRPRLPGSDHARGSLTWLSRPQGPGTLPSLPPPRTGTYGALVSAQPGEGPGRPPQAGLGECLWCAAWRAGSRAAGSAAAR